MLRTKIVAHTYEVSMSVKEFIYILDKDAGGYNKNNLSLLEIMDKIGAEKINYSGHFGAAIWYMLKADDKEEETQAKILEAIKSYISK